MAVNDGLASLLRDTHRYFRNTISVLGPEDGDFAPNDEVFTVSAHIAHTADTVEWFMEGAFGEGFSMDFEAHEAKARGVGSFEEALAWLDRAFDEAAGKVMAATEEELRAPLPEGPIMGGEPRLAVISAIVDHTAHHRGSLAVYARLLGKVPVMPYS